MTIIPSAPLVVNVERSGGLLGRTVAWRAVAAPASALHHAAIALLRAWPPPTPATPATRSRDGFTYAVTIAEDATNAAELLDARYHDPPPAQLADLLAALRALPPRQ